MRKALWLLLFTVPCAAQINGTDPFHFGQLRYPCANSTANFRPVTITTADGRKHSMFCSPPTAALDSSSFSGSANGIGYANLFVGMYVADGAFESGNTIPNGTTYGTLLTTKYGDTDVQYSDKNLTRMRTQWGFNAIFTSPGIYFEPWYKNAAYPADAGGFHVHTDRLPAVPNVRPGFYSVVNRNQNLPETEFLPHNVEATFSPMSQKNYGSNTVGWSGGSHNSCDWWQTGSGTLGFPCFDWEIGELSGAGHGQNSIFGTGSGLASNLDQKAWLMAVAGDDSDQIPWAVCSPTYPCPNQNTTGAHKGFLELASSPVVTGTDKITEVISGAGTLYFDPTNYAKKHLHDALKTEYVTIAALNAAWGSSYTSFETSGTCYGTIWPSWLCPSPSAADAQGTTDGVASTFTGTLSHLTPSQDSVIVKLNGTPVASGTQGPNQGFQTAGTLVGPQVTASTINYTTGAWSITFAANIVDIWNVRGNGANVITADCWHNTHTPYECGFYAGETVTIASTTHYNGACVVASVPVETVFTCTQTNINTAVETGTAVPASAVPPTSLAITFEYIQNGWGGNSTGATSLGTGLMDECNCGDHNSFVGTDYVSLSGQTAAMRTDLDQQLQDDFTQYFKEHAAAVHQVFGANQMVWSTDSLTRKGVITRPAIMKAVKTANTSGWLDAVIGQGIQLSVSGGQTTVNSELADWETYAGQAPMVNGMFYTANLDSPFATGITGTSTCTAGNVTVNVSSTALSTNSGARNIGNVGSTQAGGRVLSSGQSVSAYNSAIGGGVDSVCAACVGPAATSGTNTNTTVVYPVTCGASATGGRIAQGDYDNNATRNYPTQQARAQGAFADVNAWVNTDKLPVSGLYFTAGIGWWDLRDDNSQDLDWGWVTPQDNAKDGVEDVATASVNCDSTPSLGSICGGEYNGLAMGNFIGNGTDGLAKNANLLGLGLAALGNTVISGQVRVAGQVVIH